MGDAVVLQIEQKMERQEIGDMERNKGNGYVGKRGGRHRYATARQNIQVFAYRI